jgi:hypothetical protein
VNTATVQQRWSVQPIGQIWDVILSTQMLSLALQDGPRLSKGPHVVKVIFLLIMCGHTYLIHHTQKQSLCYRQLSKFARDIALLVGELLPRGEKNRKYAEHLIKLYKIEKKLN